MLCIFLFQLANPFKFDVQDYIHRVGRTARGEKGKGSALLFLLPQELKFLIYLKVINSTQ
jgi:superfamily II DNA/RNA helicase